MYRGFDARFELPAMDPVDLTVTSTPYLWRSKYSDATDEFGAGSLDRFIHDQRNLAANIWDATRPGGWYVLNLGDSRSNTGGAGGDISAAGKRVYRQGEHGLTGQQWIGVPWRSALAIQSGTGWRLTGEIIWDKGRPVRSDNSAFHLNRNRRPGLSHEFLFMFWKPEGPQTWNADVLTGMAYDPDAGAITAILDRYKAKLGRWHNKDEADAARRVRAAAAKTQIGSVWRISPSTKRPSSAETSDDTKAFPLEIPDRFIRLLTNPGDLVLDPCAGYGTTGLAALENDRRAMMFDLYCGTHDWPSND